MKAWESSQSTTVRLSSGKTVARRLRKDSPCLAAGVISFPRARIDEWPAYRNKAIDLLRLRHGERLRLVVEHQDEAHPHIHFYAVSNPGEDFGKVHDGYQASRQARKGPGNRIRAAYQDAMRKWQDWLHEALAKPFGLARTGPRRDRKTRDEWRRDEDHRWLVEQTAKAAKLMADLERRDALLKKKRDGLDRCEIEMKTSLAARINATKKREQEVERLLLENQRARQDLADLYASLSEANRRELLEAMPEMLARLSRKSEPTRG